MWTGYGGLSESWHSSTTLKKYQNKKSCKWKRTHRKYCFHKHLIALAQPCGQNRTLSLPTSRPLQKAKMFSSFSGRSACDSSSGTKDVPHFQTLILKIQGWLVELTEGIIRYFPTKILFGFSPPPPSLWWDHILILGQYIWLLPIWNKLV